MRYKFVLRAIAASLLAATSAQSLESTQGPASTFSHLTIGRFTLSGVAPLNTAFSTVRNPNAIIAGPGNSVSFCPELSCVSGPPNGSVDSAFGDHQRTSLLISAATQDDAHSEEQTVAITTTIATGYLTPYAPKKAYALGANIAVGNAVYRAVQAGTSGAKSAPPGERPNSVPFTVSDGSVRWLWINDAAIASKVGLYNEVVNKAGGGASWAQANNFELHPGHSPSFNINTEFDFTNNSGKDCVLGLNCISLYVAMGGANKSTAGVNILSNNVANHAAIWGLRLNGAKLASDAAIALDANSRYGIAANQLGLGGDTYSEALILDNSTGARSLEVRGAKTVAAIEDKSNSPTALSISGTKTIASIYDTATAPNGLSLNGTYSGSQVVGKNWNVNPAGLLTAAGLNVSGITYQSGGVVPGSSTAPCTIGQAAWDANYEYRCVSKNKWKRAALSDW